MHVVVKHMEQRAALMSMFGPDGRKAECKQRKIHGIGAWGRGSDDQMA